LISKTENDENNIVPSNKLVLETANDLESELAKFRSEWKEELNKQDANANTSEQITDKQINDQVNSSNIKVNQSGLNNTTKPVESDQNNDDLVYDEPKNTEQKAQYLFNKGVLLEQQGRFFEAIKFYRMAIQLDADIEFKIASQRPSKTNNKQDSIELIDETNTQSVVQEEEEEEAETDSQLMSLYEQFQMMTLSENRYCEPLRAQKSIHFSQLPIEVIMLILKWVVSSHLDMRSLNSFSAVCKGFYVCANSPDLWKLACAKVWGNENINNYLSTYGDWKTMFFERARLNFDGVYISKTAYARAGEQSLDNFYRPWHLVEYFRYFRFFSDGNVVFLTTPDEPKSTVSKLKAYKHQTSNNSTSLSFNNNFAQSEQGILRGK
jgi:hypothetical protein